MADTHPVTVESALRTFFDYLIALHELGRLSIGELDALGNSLAEALGVDPAEAL